MPSFKTGVAGKTAKAFKARDKKSLQIFQNCPP